MQLWKLHSSRHCHPCSEHPHPCTKCKSMLPPQHLHPTANTSPGDPASCQNPSHSSPSPSRVLTTLGTLTLSALTYTLTLSHRSHQHPFRSHQHLSHAHHPLVCWAPSPSHAGQWAPSPSSCALGALSLSCLLVCKWSFVSTSLLIVPLLR